MNYKEKIFEMIKQNNGHVTTKEIVQRGINRFFLTQMVKDGTILRYSKGYYGLKNYIKDEFYEIQLKSNQAIFSMNTALYLHGLSDRVPTSFDVTVPYNYGGSLQKQTNVNLNFVNKTILHLGATETLSPFGMQIRVYDIEKTICDIIKNKHKTDSELFSKALKNYAKLENKNLTKLISYSKIMKIENKVRQYMEVLL